MAIINRGERYHKLLPEASTKEFVTFAVYESKEIRDFEKSSQKEWDIFKKAVENKLAKYTEDSEIFDSSGLKSDNPADLKKYLQRGIEEYPLLTEKERSYFRNNYFVDESKLEDDLYNIFFEPVILNIGKEKALLERAFEVSSMGIRVDEEALDRQLTIAGCDDRRELPFHKMLLNGELPYTIGGGIGQSRICMYLLRKAHIGEVQSSVWDDKNLKICEEHNITLL